MSGILNTSRKDIDNYDQDSVATMMIQACLNGARSKAENADVPVTSSELALSAKQASEAGASCIHFHPRNNDGAESLAPTDVAASIEYIREVVPGLPLGVGTGIWIEPTGTARLEHIRNWSTRPDYASVNMNEADAEENMRVLNDLGVRVEAGIWTAKDAEKYLSIFGATDCLRILLEMTSEDPVEAEHEYRKCMAVLDKANVKVPILLHGEGDSMWAMVGLAQREGHDTRVGFEDGVLMPDGTVAKSNAEFVRQAVLLGQ